MRFKRFVNIRKKYKTLFVYIYHKSSRKRKGVYNTFIYGWKRLPSEILLLKKLFKSIVLVKRYINCTGGSENVDFFNILQYSCSFLFKIDEWSIKYWFEQLSPTFVCVFRLFFTHNGNFHSRKLNLFIKALPHTSRHAPLPTFWQKSLIECVLCNTKTLLFIYFFMLLISQGRYNPRRTILL